MSTSPTSERDPVCGMGVNPATARHVHPLAGKPYYFCCAPCLDKFKADPDKYLTPRPSGLVTLGALRTAASPAPYALPAVHPATPQSTTYVCPMCTEVRETKPGACPSCGMALEPDLPVSAARTEYTCPMRP